MNYNYMFKSRKLVKSIKSNWKKKIQYSNSQFNKVQKQARLINILFRNRLCMCVCIYIYIYIYTQYMRRKTKVT